MKNTQWRRRDFLKAAGIGAASCTFGNFSCSDKASGNLPNIVFILADDMGYGDLQCLNQDSKIPTPNMDRLASEGMYFSDAHSGSAVCTPTRYGLLTGRYAWRTRLKSGVLWGYSPHLIDPQRMTVASLLKRQGYHTACVGKWHLGLDWQTTDGKTPGDSMDEPGETVDYSKPIMNGPNELGFDYFFGIPASLDMVPYVYIENDHVVEEPTETIHASKKGEGGFWRAGPIAPGFRHDDVLPTLTGKAATFINRHAETGTDSPFFLYLPLTAPHTPWVPAESFKGRSEAGDYGDFVAQVDGTAGEIMKALDRHNLTANTLIIVTSDNGSHWQKHDIEQFGHRANHHFRGMKSDVWDGGHRIPFIARWPEKIEPGTSCDTTICLTDLLATAADIAGVELPGNAGEDSFSFLPALLDPGNDAPVREAIVHHSIDGMFAIRKDRWKLILGQGSGGWSMKPQEGDPPGQLYDMAADVEESDNLYDQRPDIVGELTALLENYKKKGNSR